MNPKHLKKLTSVKIELDSLSSAITELATSLRIVGFDALASKLRVMRRRTQLQCGVLEEVIEELVEKEIERS